MVRLARVECEFVWLVWFWSRQTLKQDRLLQQIIYDSFQSSTTTGYRPVNAIIHKLGVAFFSTPDAYPHIFGLLR